VYVNFAIHDRLIVQDDPGGTARNILAHEKLFRVGIVGDLVYCAGIVVLLSMLYIVLKPISHGLALLAALWRLVWVLMWLVMTLNLFDALRLLKGTGYLLSLEPDRLQILANFHVGTRFDYYYVGLLFGSLASTLCGYLWLRSRYIPKVLAIFGIASSAFCVLCTLLFYVFPDFNKIVNLWLFDSPMGIFDIVLSFWLLFKGLRSPATGVDQAK
jgi:hypothetical protein